MLLLQKLGTNACCIVIIVVILSAAVTVNAGYLFRAAASSTESPINLARGLARPKACQGVHLNGQWKPARSWN